MSRLRRLIALGLAASACGGCGGLLAAQPAAAFDPLKAGCTVLGAATPLGGACAVAGAGKRVLEGGAQVLTGHPGQGVATVAGGVVGSAVGSVASSGVRLMLGAIAKSILDGAASGLRVIAGLLDRVSAPQLQATWFQGSYWRMTAIAALLTVPFLFACAVQCVLRGDPAPLLQAAFGFLPLSALAIAVASQLTSLLLAATDELCAIVVHASGGQLQAAFTRAITAASGLSAATGSPFFVLLIGFVTTLAALALWIELLLRSAAVYVVVLMLPVVFASLVWPARRIWSVRVVELLAALIVSKFAIVAVLTLGGAALAGAGAGSLSALMSGAVLLMLGAFAPWAVLRLLPQFEPAGAVVPHLRAELSRVGATLASVGVNAATLGARGAGAVPAIAGEAAGDRQAHEAALAAIEGLPGGPSGGAQGPEAPPTKGPQGPISPPPSSGPHGPVDPTPSGGPQGPVGPPPAGSPPEPGPEPGPAVVAAPNDVLVYADEAARENDPDQFGPLHDDPPADAARIPALDDDPRWQKPNHAWRQVEGLSLEYLASIDAELDQQQPPEDDPERAA